MNEQDENDPETIDTKVSTVFRNDIVKEALKLQFSNAKNKITENAVDLVAEISKAMVIEVAVRAAKQASLENKSTVSLEHVENVLPQLMMDFP